MNLVIRCGCGRTMNPDGRRGRGAYRCGCGTTLRVAEAPPDPRRRQCWWDNCTTIAHTAAPVALCEKHLGETIHELVGPKAYQALWAAETERYVQEHPPESLPPHRRVEVKPTWVYFLRREVLIKIGYSNDPASRASALGAVLLAQMPGDRKFETLLHRKFKHLQAHGEWFRPGPDLLAMINQLRGGQDLPPITDEPPRHLYEAPNLTA